MRLCCFRSLVVKLQSIILIKFWGSNHAAPLLNVGVCEKGMKFEELGIQNSLLWFFIAIFLFFWLGNQLLGAITYLEIQNLRVTDMVYFYCWL